MNMQENETNITLSDYYNVMFKHRWLICICFVLVVSLTVFFTFQMTPVYEAATTMVIEDNYAVSPATGEQIEYGGYINQQMAFNTHLKMLTSRPVLEAVVRRLGLDAPNRKTEAAHTEFIPVRAFWAKIMKNIRLITGDEEKDALQADPLSAAISALADRITIEEVRDTHLLRIRVEDPDPVRAREIANALTQSYIEFDAGGRLRSSRDMLKWMTAQLYETRKKLEDAEVEFQAFKQQEKIFSIEGKQNMITQKIGDFNDAYLEARNQRLELDARLAELKRISKRKGQIHNARMLIDNTTIDTLYGQILEAEVEHNRLSRVYKEKHPKIQQIISKITKTRRKLNDEIRKEMENLKAQRTVLISKENVLQETIAGFENDALETNKKELRYTILRRNVETGKKLYDTLLGKIEASNIDEKLDISNIRVVEQADLPESPVRPNRKRNILLGIVLGGMFGIGLAFLREYLDQSFRTEEDIQKYLDLPVLSVIPEAEKP
ncbi:lipopolysaccharide biosynthesis protein [Desulfonema ishimotonii]|uniref:Lipopolysaccharide biosynthesis protein n=1 Tax=Desulfonema ishimotonii TaxID=45657 RepID=A0A401FZ49_9BACT|nr:GumC family protein [Desulfonema ishimotonii]GBC62230.1 lipopolysaccharide biosynthesis protein [Desulfonema ishimotonii]